MKNLCLKTTTILLNFLTLAIIAISFLGCNSDTDSTKNEDLSLTEAENMLILVNNARSDEGLEPLVLNDALNEAAYEHSLEMETNNYFSHTGLDGSSYLDRTTLSGYTGFPTGENIAKGQKNTEAAFNSWINSDGHKANILKANSTEMGLGVSGVYWTQIFGRKK